MAITNASKLSNFSSGLGSDFLTINSSGNIIISSGRLGIGTSVPDALLQVEATQTTTWSTSDGGTYSTKPYSTELAVINQQLATTNSFASIYLQGGKTTSNTGIRSARIAVLNDGTTYGSPIVFANRNASNGNMVEALRIDSQQCVGIGVTSPSAKLHVEGDSFFTDWIYSGNSKGISSDSASRPLLFALSGSEKARIDTSGRLGIGTTSVSGKLDVAGSVGTFSVATDGATVNFTRAGANYIQAAETGATLNYRSGEHIFTGTSLANERARIDTSGRLLVGTSTASNFIGTGFNSLFQVQESTGVLGFGIERPTNDTSGPSINLRKTRATSAGGVTVVQNGDNLAEFRFLGTDGTGAIQAAGIIAAVDGTPGANDMPGRLVFSTTADGASSPTERMRIANDGAVVIGKTSVDDTTAGFAWRASQYFSAVRSGGATGYINRLTNDGALLEFAQDSTTEGTISVSGTTVSYNGAHLSRWSQLPSGAERTEILRGSVLSNINEMCEWSDEENEQLNRMKVSDVEGDKNVSGVFQAWDDDDDTYTNDFYCAMTGDFIIRIGAGVTVERGDLLMSAGDGTAKPQGDGYVQDKTIAKVTSTNVSCTYEDGSYCVPCVLMAC